MPLTPTAGQIETALAGARAAVPVRFLWQRRTLVNQFRDDISAAVYDDTVPRLTLDNSRAVLRDIAHVSFRVSDLPEDFNPDSDIIAVVEQRFVLGAWRDFPLGLFRLDVGETVYGEDGAPVIECDASDLASLLVESGPQAPYTVAASTNYSTAARAVLDVLGLAHALPGVTAATPLVHTWPPYPETTWFDVLADLYAGINYWPPWPGADGRFTTRAIIDPATELAAVTYRDDAEPRLVDGERPYRRRDEVGTIANQCVVVIDDPRHPAFGFELRENADAASSVSTVYQPARQERIDYDSVPSTKVILDGATAGAIAATRLQYAAAGYRTARLSTFGDPRRDAHECYSLSLDGIESGTLWLAQSWSRDLDSRGTTMEHRISRVDAVTLTEPA